MLWENKSTLGKREIQVASDLNEDLLLELVWRWQPIRCIIYWLCQQHVSKHLFKVCGHVSLLHDAAVVLNGQNDGVATENKRGYRSLSVKDILLSVISFKSCQIFPKKPHDLKKQTALMGTHSDVTKACSLMVTKTSQNLIFVVRVCPW